MGSRRGDRAGDAVTNLLSPAISRRVLGLVLSSPQGRTGVSTQRSKLKQLSAPLLSVATTAGRGRPVSSGCYRRALELPALRRVRFPLRSAYAAVAAA